jgi:SsrA-binding protein
MIQSKIEIKNKRAHFEYFLSDELTAGIVLSGTEIKSIRLGKVNLTDAYCAFFKGELFIRNMHISEYVFGSYNRHEPRSERKLLLNRRELKKYELKTKEKGYTIIPLRLFINDGGLAKVEIALARGKKLYDKRDSLKEKDIQREMDRNNY